MGRDGVHRYVKLYSSPEQAYSEHLATQIYRDLGIPAPETGVFRSGQRVYFASRYISEAKPFDRRTATPELARQYLAGSVGDTLVHNRDLHEGDLVVAQGVLYRIDNGGSFAFSGYDGKLKAEMPGADGYHAVLARWMLLKAGLRYSERMALLRPVVERSVAIYNHYGSWKGYVDTHAPEMDEATGQTLARELTERHRTLVMQMANAPPAKVSSTGPGFESAHPAP